MKVHIAVGLPVRPSSRPSVRAPIQNLLRYSFEISYMDSSSKIIDTYFFKSGLSPFVELCSFLKGHNDILQSRFLETITAMSFKLSQVIEDNELITW